MTLAKSALAVVAAMFVTTAWAGDGPMPDEIARKLVRDRPRGRSGEDGRALCAAAAEGALPGRSVERDLKYGAAERNLLDVFMPEAAAPPRPVLIFVHGGGFTAGDKPPARANRSTTTSCCGR